MKTPYFESTWAASCVASTVGAIYTAIVATLVLRGRISVDHIAFVILITIIVSLPLLVAASALFGWRITRVLARRVKSHRVRVFAFVGMLMGMMTDLIIVLLVFLYLRPLPVKPHGIIEWMDTFLVASIPVFCLALAGIVTGAHITKSEQDANPSQHLQPPCNATR